MNATAENLTLYIYVHPRHRPWRACFTVGVQHFFVCECDTRKEAEWYVRVLETAFKSAGLTPVLDLPPFIKKQTGPKAQKEKGG